MAEGLGRWPGRGRLCWHRALLAIVLSSAAACALTPGLDKDGCVVKTGKLHAAEEDNYVPSVTVNDHGTRAGNFAHPSGARLARTVHCVPPHSELE
eukprot:599300-Amphidinium_carterae.1